MNARLVTLTLVLVARTARADAPVTIGSKLFSESVILGEIATGAVRAAGVTVKHQRALGGTRLVWDALRRGAIDVYPEYTGTLTEEILGGAGTEDLTRRLAAEGIGLSRPLGFNNTYGLAVRPALAQRLDLRRISDLRDHPELRFGLTNEILSRRDGWPGLQARYGLTPHTLNGLDHEIAYRGLAADSIDVTDVYTTDPEIITQSLVVLDDDRGFFPRYDAVFLYRLDLESRAPAAIAALRRLEGKISERDMAAMNGRAKAQRIPEDRVAADFLARTFGISGTIATPGRLQRVAQRTAEHLWLVALSLGLAILIAIPLGILASRRPRLGQILLAAVGVVQTIPSLALLVIMIPLLGIGTTPAIVALFLYSLLPIVRNTVAGLADVPPLLRESAEALGLSRGAILRLVELPLARRSILAGIKSAAVINVGTATLGALVGAGGLGQPIFTGIRLADTALLLEGAIPASLLALAVQGAFELVERLVVPRGLRL